MKKLIILSLFLPLLACEDAAEPSGSDFSFGSGTGGSLARFTIVDNYLYTVENKTLSTYYISSNGIPVFRQRQALVEGLETIFSRENLLFIGSANAVFIYDISNPENPRYASSFQHNVACDPVVADDEYAYVTLRTGENRCTQGVNQLEILNITNLENIQRVAIYPMDEPKGLGIAGDTLFLCDDELEVYNVANVDSLVKVNSFPIDALDVIPNRGNLIVLANNGLYQYRYDNDTIQLRSKLADYLL